MLATIAEVWDGGRFVLGPQVEGFEREMSACLDGRFAVGASSGTDALLLGLLALGVGPGDEVITSPLTFVATAEAIVRVGAVPVFVDIDSETLNVDPAAVLAAIGPKTKAVLPVHLFGLPADMERLTRTASDRELIVLEDAAQAQGATCRGVPVGSWGDAAAFSFFPAKMLGGAGDAGMLACRDESVALRARALRNHGTSDKENFRLLGGNFRMDELQAAVLRLKLKHLAHWIEQRRLIAVWYRELLGDVPGVVLPPSNVEGEHVYNYYVVQVEHRDRVLSHLRANGIEAIAYYRTPLHLQTCFHGCSRTEGPLPKVQWASERLLALPMFPGLTQEEVAQVASALKGAF